MALPLSSPIQAGQRLSPAPSIFLDTCPRNKNILRKAVAYKRSAGVKITSKFECFQHSFTVGHVSKDSQLKLAIVCNYEAIPWLCNESFPNLVYVFVTSRLVLQVWFPAGYAPCFSVEIHAAVYPTIGVWLSL